MIQLLMNIICFVCLFSNRIILLRSDDFNCHLPEGCRFESVYFYNYISNERGFTKPKAIMCDINSDEFEFKFKEPSPIITGNSCVTRDINQELIFRHTSNDLYIFDKRANFTNAIRYLNYFTKKGVIYFWGIKGFDLNFIDDLSWIEYAFVDRIQIFNGRFDFYNNKKRIESCDDIINSNLTQIQSIFHTVSFWSKYNNVIELINVEYKNKICPLVFNNSMMVGFYVFDLVNTFYKKNVLSFTRENFTGFFSGIGDFGMFKVYDINLDSNLVSPEVFKYTVLITVGGSLNSIEEEIFLHLEYLSSFKIDPLTLRKINHKQGIKWIRNINHNVRVNLSENPEGIITEKCIILSKTYKVRREHLWKIFPDEDFCIYVDFPFNQLVVLYEYYDDARFNHSQIFDIINTNEEFTCTYLWLIHYYEYFYEHISKSKKNNCEFVFLFLMRVMNTSAFKSMSKCNFEERISLCNKSNYQIKDIWDENDFLILNKKIQTAFKILIYPISFLSLITNFIVVLVILKKDNSDLFKGFKQYSYLFLNSIFCMAISVIEILSWMTECFYPFQVFCPEIRKLVAIQFLKIIFKECLITMFRFMCNFTYVAFALNRIGLIGKEHGKIVTFFSDLGIKKYIGVTLFISASFSWIKYFKYEVNYKEPYFNYPISNEIDIFWSFKERFYDFYFIYNSICDFFNYIVFVIICIIIDICMVVQLRRVLEEKMKKSESLNQKQNETKKAENEKAVHKAMKMVVLNSVIGIFFKIPVYFVPLLNMCIKIHHIVSFIIPYNDIYLYFYYFLSESGFSSLIQDISYFLYTLSLSILLFIYICFDKKFRTGYDRLKDKTFSSIKNRFKSNS